MKRVVVLTRGRAILALSLSLVIGIVIGVAAQRSALLRADPSAGPAVAGSSSQAGREIASNGRTTVSQSAEVEPAQLEHKPAAGAQTWIQTGDWLTLEHWLNSQSAANDIRVDFGLSEQLLAGVRNAMSKHNAVILRRVMRQYLTIMPEDLEAWFLLADLQLLNGLRENTIETYFQILEMQPPVNAAARARRDVDQLINVMDLEFKTRGANAEREAFWRHLTARYPPSDFYRYRLAQVLAADSQWTSATRVLAETGTVDVEQANLDALLVAIEDAQNDENEINFTRNGDRLIARVRSLHGLSFALLVDTGATITGFSKVALRRLGARREAQDVRLQTASGIIDADLYRVAALEIEGRLFENLRVVELPVDIHGVDGLLGVDILDRLPWSVESSP